MPPFNEKQPNHKRPTRVVSCPDSPEQEKMIGFRKYDDVDISPHREHREK
jgi:hypothetical protein